VQPGPEAASIIASDCGAALYKTAHVNFTREPTDSELDEFAKTCVDKEGAGMVHSVTCHPFAFRCPGPRLVSLGLPDTFATLMGAGAGSDSRIESEMSAVVSGKRACARTSRPRVCIKSEAVQVLIVVLSLFWFCLRSGGCLCGAGSHASHRLSQRD
jgi:hypothetical protein